VTQPNYLHPWYNYSDDRNQYVTVASLVQAYLGNLTAKRSPYGGQPWEEFETAR
jgi:hypothetical protein